MEIQKIKQNPIGLLEILHKIRVRPGMYIGRPSVSDLFIFLAGYKTARRELGLELTWQEEDFCEEFQPWLQKKFKTQTVKSWAQIILMNAVDEAEAFTEFFVLLDEFVNRQKPSVTALQPQKAPPTSPTPSH